MKKYIFLAIAAFTLLFVSCQKNELMSTEPSSFELVANIAKTKTTLSEDFKVEWEDGDVIYMVTSDETWGAAWSQENSALESIAEFVYNSGKFTTESQISPGEYTFNALYARADQKTYHRGKSNSHRLEAVQVQDCANPTAEVKKNDALIGTFNAEVPMRKAAEVNMQHLYTLMRVDIKNETGATVEVKKFEMTAADAALAGVFNVKSFATPEIETKTGASSNISVELAGGNVATGKSLPVYFVMAPLTNYTGDVTFKVTDSENKTYTKTVTISGKSFEAGHYNTTPYTICEADAADPTPEGQVTATLTFDSKDKRTEYSTSKQVWEENGIKLTNDKEKSTTNVGDYANPARFYKNSTIKIEAPGYITKIEFNSVTGEKFDFLKDLLPNASVNGAIITEVYDGSSTSVSYSLTTGQIQLNSITVTYSSEGYVPPTLESIAVSGNYKTEFVQGDNFSFGGEVTATYSNESTKPIAEKDCTFSGYDLAVVGKHTVTVTYEGKSTTYDINVAEAQIGGDEGEEESGWVLAAFNDLKEGDQVVIVSTKDSYIYAMSNNNGTGSAPTATPITYRDDKLTAEPDPKVIWSVGVDGDNRIFYLNSTMAKWLYCTNTNNGVRVGDNSNKTFALDASGYLKHIGTSRYVGVYNNSDWRCYTSVNDNIKGQTFQFFVKQGGSGGENPEPDEPETPVEPTLSPRNLAFVSNTANATMGEAFTAPILNGEKTGVTYTSSNTNVATVDASTGTVSLVGAGTTTITASAPATDQYEAGEASYTLTVNDAASTKKTYTLTIDISSFNGTSYAANNNEKTSIATASDGTTMQVKWTSNQVMLQSSAMQWQKSKGYIYNSTDLGTIKDITITSSEGTFTKYIGPNSQPTSVGTGGYFKISVGSTLGKTSKVVITFEK